MTMTKALKFLFIALTMSIFTGCSSNDDEPENTDMQMKQQYEAIVSRVYQPESGEPIFTASQVEGVYLAVANSQEVSRRFCGFVIGSDWNGTNTTVSLGDYGSIRLFSADANSQSQGIYHQILVNVKDHRSFTLKIFDKDRVNDDNGYTGTGVAITNVEDVPGF